MAIFLSISKNVWKKWRVCTRVRVVGIMLERKMFTETNSVKNKF